MVGGMTFVAATETIAGVGRLATVPMNFWVVLAMAVAAIIAVVLVLRRLAQTNKALLSIVALVFVSVVGFSWIYERNEPTWATPAVSFLAGFFPTKGKVTVGQKPH
jgi:hypothetical protein